MRPIQPTTSMPSRAAIAMRSGSVMKEATSSRAEGMSCQAEGTCASALTRIAAACSRCDADAASNGMVCTTTSAPVWPDRNALIQIEFVALPVLGANPPHRAGDGAHHHRFGLDDTILAEAHALEQIAVGHAGRREQAIAFDHVFDAVLLARIFDAHLDGALALLLGVEHEPALHLAADAAQRRRCLYRYRCRCPRGRRCGSRRRRRRR